MHNDAEHFAKAITLEHQINDASDALGKATKKLEALLALIDGDGFKEFQCLNETLQANYLWACADFASAARREYERMSGMVAQKREAAIDKPVL